MTCRDCSFRLAKGRGAMFRGLPATARRVCGRAFAPVVVVISVAALGVGAAAPAGATPPELPAESSGTAESTSGHLSGVACLSTNSCYAVGGTSDKTLVQRWDGTEWSIVASPNPPRVAYTSLADVSCANARSCFAVGSSQSGTGNTVGRQLIEQWDGTRWSIVVSPKPPGAANTHLTDVACLSPKKCFAVGTWSKSNGAEGKTLIEQWDGTRWSIAPSPNPPGGSSPYLGGVACSSAKHCVAVGSYRTSQGTEATSSTGFIPDDGTLYRTLVEQWDGTRWSIIPSPTPPGTSYPGLAAVACHSAKSCVAVGGSVAFPEGTPSGRAPAAGTTLVEEWNGTSWSIVPSPNPPGASGGDSVSLGGVACPSATRCLAVGSYGCCEDNTAFVEQWDGTGWSMVTTPTLSGSYGLGAVACPSTTSCFAVGEDITARAPLIEHWDGTTWSIT